jgi:hypothetical protein
MTTAYSLADNLSQRQVSAINRPLCNATETIIVARFADAEWTVEHARVVAGVAR